MTRNILISGSMVYDRIMDFPGYFKDHILPDKIHNLNVSFLINSLKENFGGTAGNIAYNLSLLGEKPNILATAGSDFGPYKKYLKKIGVRTDNIKKLPELLTAGAYIMTDKADNQITGFNLGAMAVPRGEFNSGLLKNCLAIVSPGNIKDMENYSVLYTQKKIKYIFDPGQSITALSGQVLKKCIKGAFMLIGNDYEIEMVKKKIGWTDQDLIGKINVLIVTKGERGSSVYDGGNEYKIPAAKTGKVVDPTGAGDAYRAGLIKGIVSGWDTVKSAKLGSAVASFAVEKYGGQNHFFTAEEAEKRMK